MKIKITEEMLYRMDTNQYLEGLRANNQRAYHLLKEIIENRSWYLYTVLADALEEGGVTDEQLLHDLRHRSSLKVTTSVSGLLLLYWMMRSKDGTTTTLGSGDQ